LLDVTGLIRNAKDIDLVPQSWQLCNCSDW